jgi:hypothetical protein
MTDQVDLDRAQIAYVGADQGFARLDEQFDRFSIGIGQPRLFMQITQVQAGYELNLFNGLKT